MNAAALQEIEVAAPRRKWPCYPEYKPTEISWIGKIPQHWDSRRLKHLGQAIIGLTYSPVDICESDEGTLVLRASNIQNGRIALDDNVYVNAPIPHDLRTRENDILICSRNGSQHLVGKCALIGSEIAGLSFGAFMTVFRSRINRYLFWPFSSGMMTQRAGLYQTSTIFQLTSGILNEFRVPIPPIDEQRAVAAFLDRETAQIDALIARKRKLIDLLKEKRQAAISRGVTKGLDPNAPMKPSGIDWLGEIPAHWSVLPIKHLARVGNGSTPSRENADYWHEGHYPWLNSSVVNGEVVTDADQFVTRIALHECHLPRISPPAVLVGITGEGRTRGMATTLLIEATINQHLAYLKPKSKECDVFFLRRVLDRAYQYLRDESDGGGSTKGAITCEQLGNLRIPVPPMLEQKLIVGLLDSHGEQVSALDAKVQTAINRLIQYRSALITAAVTGQIDIRRNGKEAT